MAIINHSFSYVILHSCFWGMRQNCIFIYPGWTRNLPKQHRECTTAFKRNSNWQEQQKGPEVMPRLTTLNFRYKIAQFFNGKVKKLRKMESFMGKSSFLCDTIFMVHQWESKEKEVETINRLEWHRSRDVLVSKSSFRFSNESNVSLSARWTALRERNEVVELIYLF